MRIRSIDFVEESSALEFLQKTLDSLLSHIAILEEDGTILAVNSAWRRFACVNEVGEDSGGVGSNYLEVCDRATGDCSDEARLVASGIRDVVAGRRKDFALEYPCHSPDARHWYNVRVTRFEVGDSVRVVVSHDDVTQRKLAEIWLCEANDRLETLAATDGLTGIANRRSFDLTLDREWRRHRRDRTPLSVALLDVDYFKQFNDRLGHPAGDDCLQRVAGVLVDRTRRPGDFVARYGGEEFAVILPDTDARGASEVLGEILRSVRALGIAHPDSAVGRGVLTVSIGTSTASAGDDESPARLLDRADKALYEAKSGGRDCLIAST